MVPEENYIHTNLILTRWYSKARNKTDRSNKRKWLFTKKKKKAKNRRFPTQTIMDADNADGVALLANTPTQTESHAG